MENTSFVSESNQTPISLTITQRKILLVEDDPVIQKVHRIFLEKLGYEVTTVGTGMQALTQLSEFYYDGAVMDLGLPDVTGHYVLSALRAKELNLKKRTPIIIVTAHGDQTAREECLATGADAFYIKPVSMDTFKQMLQMLLSPKSEK